MTEPHIPSDRPEARRDVPVLWCAGMCDALAIYRVRDADGTKLPSVSISTTRTAALQRLADLTGAKLTVVRRRYDRLGCGEHCTSPHLHVDSTTVRWSLTGARATIFSEAVTPHLITTRDEALAVLEVGRAAPHKPATRRKMEALGWVTNVAEGGTIGS